MKTEERKIWELIESPGTQDLGLRLLQDYRRENPLVAPSYLSTVYVIAYDPLYRCAMPRRGVFWGYHEGILSTSAGRFHDKDVISLEVS